MPGVHHHIHVCVCVCVCVCVVCVCVWRVCVQIGVECVCASVLLCVGVVSMVGRFRDIKLTTELNKRSVN